MTDGNDSKNGLVHALTSDVIVRSLKVGAEVLPPDFLPGTIVAVDDGHSVR